MDDSKANASSKLYYRPINNSNANEVTRMSRFISRMDVVWQEPKGGVGKRTGEATPDYQCEGDNTQSRLLRHPPRR